MKLATLQAADLSRVVSQDAEVTERWLCRNEIPDEMDCDGLNERAFPRLSFIEYDTYVTFTGNPISFTVNNRGVFNTFHRGDKVTLSYMPVTQELQGRTFLLGYKLLSVDMREGQDERKE
ncbi:MAG TPA: hypothetical protein HA362_01860 [Nanoarchaeota archaeon]|nr:hypothetical protein [Nanoarchaeota archaeon]